LQTNHKEMCQCRKGWRRCIYRKWRHRVHTQTYLGTPT